MLANRGLPGLLGQLLNGHAQRPGLSGDFEDAVVHNHAVAADIGLVVIIGFWVQRDEHVNLVPRTQDL